MGSPAGVSSLLTSTDMKSAIFLALFLVAAVYTEAVAEAEASPDAYYGYYGLAHGYLGYGHHGYGHLGYHGYGLHYGKREAEAEPHHGYGYYGHGHGHYGHGYGHGYYGHGHGHYY